MPARKRCKTAYRGVFYVIGTSIHGKPERIYHIRYWREGRYFEETAGRQFRDNMTPAKASRIRVARIENNQSLRIEGRIRRKGKNRWTFDRLWETYKTSTPLKGLVSDENRFDNHISPVLGNKEPKELNPLELDRLRIRLLKKLSPQSVKHVLALIRRLINFGEKKQLCNGPGFTITMPRVDNVKTEDLTPEQMDNLLKALDESTNVNVANLMRLALLTGMRRGELFRLQWKDIDFQRGFIHIRDPKGGEGQKIPLNKEARALLQDHPEISEFVFPGRNGEQRREIKREVKKIKEAAGLPKDFRPLHGLRHVYASMLASSGQVDLYTLQKLLTHKSPQMTQRYAHLRDEALRKASDLAGSLISRQADEKVISLKESG